LPHLTYFELTGEPPRATAALRSNLPLSSGMRPKSSAVPAPASPTSPRTRVSPIRAT
jgi:hypothetical protein